MEHDADKLKEISKSLRKIIFRMAHKAGGAHLGACFSSIDILTALYFGGILRFDPDNPAMKDRDRLILSKGHASAALYAVLSRAGYFPPSVLDTYCQEGSVLGGHPNMLEVPGVEASTGALGHGFGFAAGIALAGKLNRQDYRVFAILGDGECQEGSVWETALMASSMALGNFTAIIDFNKLQAMDRLENIIKMEPFAEKWRSFGWHIQEVDGHNAGALIATLGPKRNMTDKPLAVIAHTVKGKGVSCMENNPLWHYRMPNEEELKVFMRELQMDPRELD